MIKWPRKQDTHYKPFHITVTNELCEARSYGIIKKISISAIREKLSQYYYDSWQLEKLIGLTMREIHRRMPIKQRPLPPPPPPPIVYPPFLYPPRKKPSVDRIKEIQLRLNSEHPRNVEIFKLRNEGVMFKTLAEKYGVTVPRVRQIYYKRRERLVEVFMSHVPRSRPIDMGGPRDVWIESTPQSLYEEENEEQS